MTLRKTMTALTAGMGMLILILDGQTALQGAAAGTDLCIRTVVPALFPFLFLCSILTTSVWGVRLGWLRQLSLRLGIPSGAESILISALLGGYPAGAQVISEAFQYDRISREDAQHLLTFCSNAGPAFLFGMTALQFPSMDMAWALWAIQILSALFTGLKKTSDQGSVTVLPPKNLSVSRILTQTVKTMAVICGWILLFQILLAFLNRWFFWYFPKPVSVFFTGLLELSSGCCALEQIGDVSLRFVVCTAMVSFGGLCVTMQTASIIGTLSLKPYLLGKMMHTGTALILAILYLQFGWVIFGAFAVIFLFFSTVSKKRSGFPLSSGV